MCQKSKQTTAKNHAEHGKTRMARDEQDVIKIVEYVAESQNPFDLDTVPDELVNITTGLVASPEVSLGLGNFLEVAQKRNITFVEKRLVVDRTLSFWDTDKRSKTPTFVNMSKSLTSNKPDKTMMDSEVLFRRLLAVSKQRDVNLEQVLSHELAPVPPSLFNDDGTMRKTTKADLAKKLESNCNEIQVLAVSHDNRTAYIVDGMALLQALDESKFDTFNDLGLVVKLRIQSLLSSNLGVTSVTLVFDRYDSDISIKQQERDRRAGRDTTPTYVISGRRRVPNYRKFMKNATNKSALAEFICVYLTDTAPQILKEHQWLMLAGGFTNGQLVKVVEHTGVRERPELFSTHRGGRHKNPAACNRSRYNTLEGRCQMRRYWCISPSNILLCQGYVRQLQSIHERWSLQQNNKSPEVHSCQRNNIENWARCFDLLTSGTCYQRLRYNLVTLQNRQANRLQHARGQHRRHAVFGRARSV